MPTLNDIEGFDAVLEAAFAAGVNAALGEMPFLLAADFQRKTPRVEIVVAVGNATGARRGFPKEGITRFVRWNFTVKFTVITRPAEALTRKPGESDDDFRGRQNANLQLHQTMVATVRGYAGTASQGSWEDLNNFPYHYIAEPLKDAGSLKRLKPEEGNNQTALLFAGVIGVRENAWAAIEEGNAIPEPPPPAGNPLVDTGGNEILDTGGNAILGF